MKKPSEIIRERAEELPTHEDWNVNVLSAILEYLDSQANKEKEKQVCNNCPWCAQHKDEEGNFKKDVL